MPHLKIFVGEKLAEQLDLDSLLELGFTESQQSYESTGKTLRQKPPRPDLSIFSAQSGDVWYDFYDRDGPIRKYTYDIRQAQANHEDLELYFPEEFNPDYAGKA